MLIQGITYNLDMKNEIDKKIKIIKEAEILFAKKGFYGMGLQELLSVCDIPKGSFYYYFPKGKNELIQETLRYSYDRMSNSIKKNSFIAPTANEAFESMAERLASKVGNTEFLASLLLSMISIESVYLDAEINLTCKDIYNEWQKLYSDQLRLYGYGDSSVVKAQAIFALIHGSLISSWIKNNPEDLRMIKSAINAILNC